MPPRCHVDRRISQEARGGGRSRNPFPTLISLACASRPIVFSIRLRRSAGVSVAPVNGTRTTSEAARRTTGVSESVYDHCDPFGTQRKPTHCESYTSITGTTRQIAGEANGGKRQPIGRIKQA